ASRRYPLPGRRRPGARRVRDGPDGQGDLRLAGGVDAEQERERQERGAVREAQGKGHVEGAGGEDRELARCLESRRQEVRLLELVPLVLVAGRHDRAEEGGRPQGRQSDGAQELVKAAPGRRDDPGVRAAFTRSRSASAGGG